MGSKGHRWNVPARAYKPKDIAAVVDYISQGYTMHETAHRLGYPYHKVTNIITRYTPGVHSIRKGWKYPVD